MPTLKQYSNHVVRQHTGLKGIDVITFVDSARAYEKGLKGNKAIPETEALEFYLLNHAMAVLRQQVLPNQPLTEAQHRLVDDYYKVTLRQAFRMATYLLYICTRESRHIGKNSDSYVNLAKTHGDKIKKFISSIHGSGSSTAVERLKEYPPVDKLGRYVDAMLVLFNTGSWSSGYGGKAWGAVTQLFHQWVHGEITSEMLVDQGYTLAHNNGPIFNKGMLYDSYGNKFKYILDVQRAGMIPQLINQVTEYAYNPLEVPSSLIAAHGMCVDAVGDDMRGFVDWATVEAFSADYSYKTEKEYQLKYIGVDPTAAQKVKDGQLAQEKAEALAKKEKEAKAQKEAEEVSKNWFVVKGPAPVKVKKITRSEAQEAPAKEYAGTY
ncbi:MAG: hypothetical protein OEX12_13575 [Gammaproteobacteria bacterium]|nr:hypothetical protein [Gammaproteobacteria bacterium]